MEKQKEDVNKKEEFMKEYKALVDKYGIDIVSFPQFIPGENGTWNIKIGMQILDVPKDK
jgi:hypothetical protein